TPVAFWRVAPSVRLRAFAIFAAGSLRAIRLRSRTSSFDHGRLTGTFILRATALAMSRSTLTASESSGAQTHTYVAPGIVRVKSRQKYLKFQSFGRRCVG